MPQNEYPAGGDRRTVTVHAADLQALRAELRSLREEMPNVILTSEQQRWVQLAIERESQSIAFRRAIIEKSLTMLLVSAIAGVGYVVREYMIAHGMWKP
jgi:lysyl-tRNA synthetase class II